MIIIENCNNIKNKEIINKQNKNHWIIDCGTGINLLNELNNLRDMNSKR